MDNTQSRYIIGLMSGTSLDGVDLVYVKFDKDSVFEILYSETIQYPDYWIETLKNVVNLKRGSEKLQVLDVSLGVFFSTILKEFIAKHQLKKVDLIASHGHTVHHQPDLGYTLQIGCGKEIFKATNIKTVYDFRTQDVLLGGQGAPLVPIGDEMLFSEYEYCLNLGGFSNMSFSGKGKRIAFDICPVNTVLNKYANKLGFSYDDKGELARGGFVDEKLLKELNDLKFYKSSQPKSLGVEFLTLEIFPLLNSFSLSNVDVLRTFVEHIAIQITQKINKGRVLITGGGAYNDFLLERICVLGVDLEVVLLDDKITEYKEALIFALLGVLRVKGEVNCLSSVTGATKNHSSGVVVG